MILENKILLVAQLLWITSVTSIRASVLSLYMRIFQTPSYRTTCHIVQGFNLIYYVAVVLAGCLICRPLAYLWDQTMNGSCGNQKSFNLFIAVFNLLLDVTTVTLPMPVLWGLQARTRKKLIVAGMFSMGVRLARRDSQKECIRANFPYSICAITIVRIKTATSINAQDRLQQYEKISLLTCLEALLGVISACLPVMKPIFSKLGATGIFSSFWNKPTTVTLRRPIKTPPFHRRHHLWRGGGVESPQIPPPSQIVHKDSLRMFSRTDVCAPSIPLLSFSWRPLSSFYLPRVDFEHDLLEQGIDDRNVVSTERDVGRRPSEGDSPTLPWRP